MQHTDIRQPGKQHAQQNKQNRRKATMRQRAHEVHHVGAARSAASTLFMVSKVCVRQRGCRGRKKRRQRLRSGDAAAQSMRWDEVVFVRAWCVQMVVRHTRNEGELN